MKKIHKKFVSLNNQPLLCSATIIFDERTNFAEHPFCLPLIKNTQHISFSKPVTFFVGENGAGKSTILEAIAHKIGFGPEGGSKNINFQTTQDVSLGLAEYMNLSWSYKPRDGYFFRAESFLSFFTHRLGNSGIYILDEPEAALSPQRQLALLRVIYDLSKNNTSQFIIATHSPILLAYPDATIYSCDNDKLREISYKDTSHYQITKRFLDDPECYLQKLFAQED